jgi:hypothetical protein
MPYNPKKNGAANYKSWMQLTEAQIAAIEAVEGADNTSSPNDERFAQVVHITNDKMQTYSGYNTALYQNIDGISGSAATTTYAQDTVVRIQSYEADNWVTIESAPTAVIGQGILIVNGSELIIAISAGDKIATINGKLNIVPKIL